MTDIEIGVMVLGIGTLVILDLVAMLSLGRLIDKTSKILDALEPPDEWDDEDWKDTARIGRGPVGKAGVKPTGKMRGCLEFGPDQ